MPHRMPPDAREALDTHFRSRYAERDDRAHLGTYAEDAYLVVGLEALRRGEADEAAVLAAWAQAGLEREPRFEAPIVTAWEEAGAGRALAEVAVREGSSGEDVRVLVGLKARGAGASGEAYGGAECSWAIAWAVLWPEGPRPDYARGELAALAEMTSLRAVSLQGPLTSLLEASWARQRWLPRQRLLALPETRFSCLGTGHCCSHELTIGLDENAQRFLAAVDWQAHGPDLPAGPHTEPMPEAALGLVNFRHKLRRDEAGRCRFLSADNRCTIHALAGRAVFKPCHVFPYRFAWTPDGIAVTTHAMCPTARRGLGAPLTAQEGDLRSRLQVADVLSTETFFVQPAQAVPWETFRTLEGQLLELLNGEAPIKRKLWVALRWLDVRLKHPDAGVEPAWYTEEPRSLGFMQRWMFGRFPRLFDPCFKDLAGVEAGEGILPEFERELSHFFRALLFSKVTTYPYGLVAGLNYLALVHQVLERQVARHASKGLSEAFWREFYAVVVSGTFLRVLGVCHTTPATMLARYAGSPQFGLNLLRP